MEPRGENLPASFELPPQDQETGVEHAPERTHEAERGSESTVGKQQQPSAQPVNQPVQPPATVPADPPASSSAQPPAASNDLTAQDIDLIEKQWVNRTKKVLQVNKDDPFKQKNAISGVKADYIKKRFNKDVKTGDSVDMMVSQPHSDGPGPK